jgi:hypothetical protein
LTHSPAIPALENQERMSFAEKVGTRMTRILAGLHGFFYFFTSDSHQNQKNPCKPAKIRVIRVPMSFAEKVRS